MAFHKDLDWNTVIKIHTLGLPEKLMGALTHPNVIDEYLPEHYWTQNWGNTQKPPA